MSSTLLLAAVVVSLLVGYLIADFQGHQHVFRRIKLWRARRLKKGLHSKDSRYYGALTKLLNEQPDEALDQFILALDVNAETLEMHLALGALLRRRGEFDRAVKVHQNLLTRPALTVESLHQVQLELATDYWRSGLLDRAEVLLKELTDVAGVNKGTRWQAAAYLVEIYQDLGEWLKAIDVADQLTAKKFAQEPDFWRRLQAQYCCELADQAIAAKDESQAEQRIRKALFYDPQCVRALLVRAEQSLAQANKNTARLAIEQLLDHDQSYIAEALPTLKASLDPAGWLKKLQSLQMQSPSIPLLRALISTFLERQQAEVALNFILSEVDRIPGLENEQALLIMLAESDLKSMEQKVECLRTINRFLESKTHYGCLQCGVHHDRLLWLCRQCQSWATIRLLAN